MTDTAPDTRQAPFRSAPLDVDLEVAGPRFRADPYPLWARLRAEQPVCRAGSGLWLLTRWDDVEAALRDRRFSSDQARLPTRLRMLGQPTAESMEQIFGRSMLHLDPPEHTRLRRRVNGAFTPRRIERLRPLVRELADLLLDEALTTGGMDVMTDFAYPLPITVIFEIFGIPFADRVPLARTIRFHREARLRLVLEGPDTAPVDGRSAVQVLEDTAAELRDYLTHLLRSRADGSGSGSGSGSGDDLLSELLHHEDHSATAGDPLTEAELVGTAMLLLVAGQETTINLIGNGLLALLRQPRELARLRADPALAVPAVEELLRFDTPIQVIVRVLREPVTIDGTTIPAGAEVLAVAAAANRDPARFAEPDELRLDRADAGHLSFGGGAHYCLGAPLARLEGEIAFRALATRLPGIRFAEETLQWRANPFLRGLETLPVEF